MPELNYKELGLIAGLECHQQLDVGKLFCRCPSILREDSPDKIFKRKIRPVPSELGEFEQAALDAFKKNITFAYQAYTDTTCLVELDEEPAMKVNEEALKTILEVALLGKSHALDKIYVMRKSIIDGSNVSGFQRTALVAVGGEIKIKNKKIGIQSIILEEDAARLIENTEKEIIYRIDRLGIPLIELATDPDLNSPEEVKECAFKIGEMFRITGKAKRGLGTIRQDVNISIKEGTRIEIKGVQEIELIDEFVKREVQRQVTLLEIKKELLARKIKKEELKPEFKSLADEFQKTESKIIKTTLEKKNQVYGLKLKGFKELIGKEIQPGRRLGTEFASHVKVKTGLKGLIHSDELPSYGITENEINSIKKTLKCEDMDAFVIVTGEETKTIKALEAVLERAIQALEGIPKETRNALEDGNTEYSRILSGGARMYPETDIPTIAINEKQLEELKKDLPLWADERKKLYMEKFNLNEKLAEKMKLNNHARFFEKMIAKRFEPTTLAVLLLENLVELKRNNVKTENISYKMIEEIMNALKNKKITKDILNEVLSKWSAMPEKELENIIIEMNLTSLNETEVRKIIQKIVQANQKLVKEKGLNAISGLMGDIMKEVKGKSSGQEVAKILKEELKKVME